MDTTEELHNTYFYAGRPNLSASELLFMIFCEQFAEQLGIDDFAAIVAILTGRNNLPTRTKPRDAIDGTSRASREARKVFGTRKIPWGIKLPTVVGWVVLSKDVAEITFKTITHYNSIARGNDKIW
ncbi:STM2901 family protein [Erwinia billingiae]|uniref:STM2901 family protein n=1 Tax=Erwinia billingiae TaxID=182337 RepID=UPI00320AE795